MTALESSGEQSGGPPRLRGERSGGGARLLQFEVGPARNFSYLLADEESRQAVLVDPAWEPLWLRQQAEQLGYRLAGVLLTHTHSDHMGGPSRGGATPGVRELLDELELPVRVHRLEAERVVEVGGVAPEAIRELADGDVVTLGSLPVGCLHTPGHTPGGVSFLIEAQGDRKAGWVLSGDTLFVGNVGNVEHSAGDLDAMYHSLRRLAALPPATEVFPGHDYGPQPASTVARELQLNAYLRPMKLEQWRILMGHL